MDFKRLTKHENQRIHGIILTSHKICNTPVFIHKEARNYSKIPHKASDIIHLNQRAAIEGLSENWDQYLKLMDKICRKSEIGNCVELAALACKSLRKNGAKDIDYVHIVDGVTNIAKSINTDSLI